MIINYSNSKALTLSAHQLKGKNANAVLQSELLQLSADDTIKLPDDRRARNAALDTLSLLNNETVKILIHKLSCCKYAAKEILNKVKWTDESLNLLATNKEGSGMICEWYSHKDQTYYNQGPNAIPIVSDELALKAAITCIKQRSESRFGTSTEIKEILKKFIDKISLIELAKDLNCTSVVFSLAIATNSKDLITLLKNVYETALKENNLHALKDLAVLNLKGSLKLTDPELCDLRNSAIKVHLELIQKIITMPEMIKQKEGLDYEHRVDYSSMIRSVYENYRIGFSLLPQDVNMEPPF